MSTIADILIPIALIANCISISRIIKRLDNIEQWVTFLLKKDDEYCEYKERKGEE